MVTGHRPHKIGNPQHPLRQWVVEQMRWHLNQLKPVVEQAVTGMAQGVDQDFAALCLELEIPYVAAVPFRGQDQFWSDRAREIYQKLLQGAAEVVFVREELDVPAAMALHDRNSWMVDYIGDDGIVLAVFDGTKGGTAHAVSRAKDRGRTIVRVDPTRFYEAE